MSPVIRRMLWAGSLLAASLLPLSLPGCSNLFGGEEGVPIPGHYVKISSTEGGFHGGLGDDGGHNRGAVWILPLESDGTVKQEAEVSGARPRRWG